MTQAFTDANFETEVLNDSGLVVVDFWAPWCGPCLMMGPILDALTEEYSGQVKIGKVNVDDNPATAAKYGIMSIPTLMLFKNGETVEKMIGAGSKDSLKAKIDSALG